MLLLLVVNGILLIKYLLFNFLSFDFPVELPSEPVFDSLEFILLALLFRLSFVSFSTKQIFYYSLVIYLSVMITLYLTNHLAELTRSKKNIEAIVLLALSVLVLIRQINEKSIFIFHAPLFWIAGGTLCYYSMYLGAAWLGNSGLIEKQAKDHYLLLLVFNTVRHLFYTIACFQQDKTENELRFFKESSREYLP